MAQIAGSPRDVWATPSDTFCRSVQSTRRLRDPIRASFNDGRVRKCFVPPRRRTTSDLRPTLEGGYAPYEPRTDARGHKVWVVVWMRDLTQARWGCMSFLYPRRHCPSDLRPTLEGGYAPYEPRTDARGHKVWVVWMRDLTQARCGCMSFLHPRRHCPSDLRPTLEGGYAPYEPRTDASGHKVWVVFAARRASYNEGRSYVIPTCLPTRSYAVH
jgi:hypothetical protein